MKIAFALILFGALLLIIALPAVFIWALNTLFSLSIAFTPINWLAALVLIGFFSSSSVSRS